MLSIKDISFSYKFVDVIKDFNLEIDDNKLVWIYWPSWIGKTTLLKIIGWLIYPSFWQVVFCWENIFDFPRKKMLRYRWKSVWFLFQDYNLLDQFTVRQNINLPALIWKYLIDKEWEKYLINYFWIERLLDQDVYKISGWQKERVALLRSMIHKPKLLLLDEPWNSLDWTLKTKIYSLIKNYSKNNIIIAVSHDEQFENIIDKKIHLWKL